MEDLLRRDNLKIIDFFPRVNVREVRADEILPYDPELKTFLNVNTPEDLQKIRESAPLRSGPARTPD
jgi:molybdopterin-guanine dinucleotide biosynthesis protein A